MPITREHVGRSYPPTAPYAVTAEAVAAFAGAVGDPTAGPSTAAAPPTFAIVVASRAWASLFDDPELGLALRRTMHTEQGFSWQRPLRVGDEVTAALRIDRVRQRGDTDLISVSIAVDTTAGEPVCTATGTFLHTREAA